MSQETKRDSWRKRRTFMLVAVGFCMAVIIYVLWRELESDVAETAVNMAFIIIGTTVASYVFGAAWEDIQTFQQNKEQEPYHFPGEFD